MEHSFFKKMYPNRGGNIFVPLPWSFPVQPQCQLVPWLCHVPFQILKKYIFQLEKWQKASRSLVGTAIAHAWKGQFTHNYHLLHTPFYNERHFTGGPGDDLQPFNLFLGAKELNPVETLSWLILRELREPVLGHPGAALLKVFILLAHKHPNPMH